MHAMDVRLLSLPASSDGNPFSHSGKCDMWSSCLQQVWTPRLGEMLCLILEKNSSHDPYAVCS